MTSPAMTATKPMPTTPAGYAAMYDEAHAAGMAAAQALTPVPMIVGSPSTPFGNDIDPKQPTYFVPDGVCGFAWVTVKPGTSKLARWLKAEKGWDKAYYGGIELWVHDFNQSMQKKEAYARAFAKVFRNYGVTAYAGSRMD